MSLRGTTREAVTALRRRPGLLALGFLLTLVQTAVLAFGPLVRTLVDRVVLGPQLPTQPYDPTLVAYLAPPLSALGLLFARPLFVAIYVPVREAPGGIASTLRSGAAAVRRRYRPVLAAVLRAEAVAIGVGVGGALCWYVLATAGRYIRYAVADPTTPYPLETPILLLVVFFCCYAVARFAVGFADLAVLREGVAAADAWRASVAFVRSRPYPVAGYAVVVALSGTSAALVTVAGAAPDVGPAVGVAADVGGVAAVGLAVLVTTFVAVFHAAFFDRHVRVHEVAVRARRSRWPFDAWPRVAVAAVVLVAAVGGAAAVRVDETGVHDPKFEKPSAEASPAAVYAVALENTVRSNHRAVMTSYNRSGGGRRPTLVWDWRYDYRDRQATIRFYPPARAADAAGGGGYYDSGVLGVNVGDDAGPTRNGTWTAIPAPGWAFVADRGSHGSDGGALPNADAPWTVVSNNASTLVLRVTTPEVIRETLAPESYAGMGGNMTDESRLTVWVDRERVVVDRAVWHVHSRDTGRNFSHEVRTREVGTYDVTRPESLPPRHPLEWVWDVIYY